MPLQLASARSHPLPPQQAEHGIQEEELVCMFRVRARNPSSCSQQMTSRMLFQQRMEPCVMCMWCTQYSLEPGKSILWVASSLLGGCWLLREDNYVSCFLLSVLEGVSFFHQICICGSMLPILQQPCYGCSSLFYLGNLSAAVFVYCHLLCFLPCLQYVVRHNYYKTNTRDSSEELI